MGGLREDVDSGDAVFGDSRVGHGIHGVNGGGALHKPNVGTGVYGESDTGEGVNGISESGSGVHGMNGNVAQVQKPDKGAGVWGESFDGAGVLGVAAGEHGIGVMGQGTLLAGFFNGDVDITGRLGVGGKDIFEIIRNI